MNCAFCADAHKKEVMPIEITIHTNGWSSTIRTNMHDVCAKMVVERISILVQGKRPVTEAPVTP